MVIRLTPDIETALEQQAKRQAQRRTDSTHRYVG